MFSLMLSQNTLGIQVMKEAAVGNVAGGISQRRRTSAKTVLGVATRIPAGADGGEALGWGPSKELQMTLALEITQMVERRAFS